MICHVTVQTEDIEGSIAFYQWLLELPLVRRFSAHQSDIAFLGAEETKLELIAHPGYQKPEKIEGITIGFAVEDLDAKLGLLAEREMPVSEVFSPRPGMRFCYVYDPNGVRIQLFEQK